MSDEPKDDNVTQFPKRTRRKRAPAPVVETPQLPVAQLPENMDPQTRAMVSAYVRQTIAEMESDYERRIELLRTVGEHPSPVFQRFVRNYAGLGLSKAMIARLCGMKMQMLKDHYDEDIELGRAMDLAKVAANMRRIATSEYDPNNAKVGMAWLERRGDDEWRAPAQKIEVEDKTKDKRTFDSTQFTWEERQQMRAAIERIQNGGEGDPLQPGEDDAIIE